MDFTNTDNITIMTHPVLQHKISVLRDVNTGVSNFRELEAEIALLEAYEALRELPVQEVPITTPMETFNTGIVSENKICVVPILRAGLGMLPGVLELLPFAKVGHIGMARNEETHEPEPYYCKMPKDIAERLVIIVDPMLATGGSGCDAISTLKKMGASNIMFLCIIAAPEGVERLHKEHPDVKLVIGHLDRCLNEKAYILPGLGDAGDRTFGTL